MSDLIRAEIAGLGDPEGLGRVWISIPASGGAREAWAPVLRADPAAPPPRFELGDIVMIAFEGGDPDRPIVLGALSSRAPAARDSVTAAPARASARPRSLEAGLAWDDLAFADETRERLEAATGAAADDSPSLILFHGPPGAGKTTAAAAIARRLGREIVRIDLASVVSKYIGETEKNLAAAFEAAERAKAILFFDEADALFGKRSEVEDSHDRYADIEIGHLLQRLGEFQGTAILTANLKRNLDPAFLRRLRLSVGFPSRRG